jgi:hypothetical protein
MAEQARQPKNRLKLAGELWKDDGTLYVLHECVPQAGRYPEDFHVMFDSSRRMLLQIKNASTLHVFLALPDYLNWTEFRQLNQTDLAEELGITQASVSRAMAELHTMGVVLRKGKKAATLWKLTTKFWWKGTVGQFNRTNAGNATRDIPPPPPKAAECIGGKQAPGERQPGAPKENAKQTQLRLLTTVKPASKPAPKAGA